MRISDWSSDVCSSDLLLAVLGAVPVADRAAPRYRAQLRHQDQTSHERKKSGFCAAVLQRSADRRRHRAARLFVDAFQDRHRLDRSEEHTSELQSLMRISYAVFCLKKKKINNKTKRKNK